MDTTSKSKTPFLKILIVVFALLAFGLYIYGIQKETKKSTVNTPASNKDEIMKIAEQVSKLVLVDKSIVPDVVTISDAETMIKQQPVFKGVMNGDKILVYIQEKRAIVYSPSRNIVVNILPVTMQKQPVDSMIQTVATSTAKTATTTKSKK